MVDSSLSINVFCLVLSRCPLYAKTEIPEANKAPTAAYKASEEKLGLLLDFSSSNSSEISSSFPAYRPSEVRKSTPSILSFPALTSSFYHQEPSPFLSSSLCHYL